MTAVLWLVLLASAATAIAAGLKLVRTSQGLVSHDITSDAVRTESYAASHRSAAIVERVPETETVIDLNELPSTDPATVEAGELILTDPSDVHHHHH